MMNSVWQRSAKVLAGLAIAAVYAIPQAYTISARPGAVNYIEGNAYLNGQPISAKSLENTFLNANDKLSTDIGKAEVLLTPGTFLRISDNSQIRMISPSLTDTQIEVAQGEAMIEVSGLLKENNIQVVDGGGSTTIQKDGLYRFTAGSTPTAAVLEGKAEVRFGDQKLDLGKGHVTMLAERLKSEKYDTKKEDDLFAWSNVRSEYDAAASYQTAKSVATASYGDSGWNGYGFGNWYGSGWYWNNGFNSYAWLPGAGGYYSPFGWGFFGAGYLGYAPVVVAPIYGGGSYRGRGRNSGGTATVPVNPNNPPVAGRLASSPFANQIARSQMASSLAATGGLRTANGESVAVGRSGGFSSQGISAAHSSGGAGGSGASAAHSGGGSVGAGGGSHR